MTTNQQKTTTEDWEREFDTILPCLDTHCDNDGVTSSIDRATGEPEPEQCEYCYRERLPLKNFIRTNFTPTATLREEIEKLKSKAFQEITGLPLDTKQINGKVIAFEKGMFEELAAYNIVERTADDILALLNNKEI